MKRFSFLPRLFFPLFFIAILIIGIFTSDAQVSYISLKTDTDISTSISTTLAVGSIAGSADVSSGAASYNIPLNLPSGTNGVTPSLSISYNSMGGNGIMGMGWGLSGLSMISRTGKSLLNDGIVTPVNFDVNDQFVLDGNRLIFIGTETITPQSGNPYTINVYKTENESFSKIIGTPSANGNTNFKVITKDGISMEYGFTTDSRRVSNSVVMYYKLNKVLYPDGNYMSFTYNNDNNDSRISEIIYTKNDASNHPYNKIIFTYALRTDKNKVFEAGEQYTNENLLINITIKVDFSNDKPNGDLAKIYDFKYSEKKYGIIPQTPPSGFRYPINTNSFLSEVIETGSDNTTKYNSTIFKYNISSSLYEAEAIDFGFVNASVDLQSGDFDGDGFTDILATEYEYTDGVRYDINTKVYKRTVASSAFTIAGTVAIPATNRTFKRGWNDVYYNDPTKIRNNTTTGDFTGDGKDDIISIITSKVNNLERFDGLGINSSIFNANGFNSNSTFSYSNSLINALGDFQYFPVNGRCLYTGDFDGNGIQDIIVLLRKDATGQFQYRAKLLLNTLTNSTTYIPINIQNPTSLAFSEEARDWANTGTLQNGQTYVMDHNGDGKSDIMINDGSKITVYSFVNGSANIIFSANLTIDGAARIFPGDFNGDGKTDLLYRNSDTNNDIIWQVRYSNGKGFSSAVTFSFQEKPIVTNLIYENHQLLLGDYNGDGKTDIYHGWNVYINNTTNSSKIDMYYSTGDSFSYQGNTSATYDILCAHDNYFIADINGDGKPENINVFDYSAAPHDIMYFNRGGKENLLEKVKTGVGHITEFNYNTLTTGNSFFTQGAIEAYPLNNLQPSIYTVSSIKTPNGIGGINQINFSYEKAKFHRGGRGFLGFEKIVANNLTTGFRNIVENEFNSTFFIPLTKKTSTQEFVNSAWKDLNISIFDNSVQPLGATRYFPKINNIKNYDFFEGRSSSTSNTYDGNGNITSTNETLDYITNATTNPIQVSNVETKLTVTTIEAKAIALHSIYKPKDITVTKFRDGQTSYILKTEFDYDNFGRTYTKKEFANKTNFIITTYDYTTLGNVKEIKITPLTPTLERITSYEYDVSGRFQTKTKDPLLLETSQTYDSRYGTMLTSTKENGLVTSYNYDALGRLSSTTMPEGFTVNNSYGWDISGNSVYYNLVDHPGKPNSKTWVDVLGREIKSETEGFDSENIYTIQTYNSRGNLATKTSPYKTGETPITFTNSYDGYDRLTGTSSGASGFGSTVISYSYTDGKEKISTTGTDGNISTKTIDAAGKLIEASDNGGIVSYTYNSQGNLLTTSHAGTVTTTSEYDVYGRQTKLIDGNVGTTEYGYDTIGQLITQKNPKGESHTMKYDLLGRTTEREEPNGAKTLYEYYTANSAGKADKSLLKKVTNFAGNTEEFSYDNLGRLSSTKEIIDNKTLNTGFSYDAHNLLTKTYPSGLIITYEYDANGYNTKIKNGTTILYENLGMDSFGGNTSYKTHNGNKASTNTFYYGVPLRYQTPGIQDLEMTWNYATGNLTQRKNNLKTNIYEDFTYDNLNRLKTTIVFGQNTITTNYESEGTFGTANYKDNGNIKDKTLVGTYSYYPPRINAVARLSNIISTNEQNIEYNSFDQPNSITEAGNIIEYTYGSDYNRVKSVLKQGNEVNRKYYFGDYEETVTGGVTKPIHYIDSPAGLIAIIEGTTIHYTSTDHLGSIVYVSDVSGQKEHELSYDAWGRRRNPDTWADPYSPTAPTGLPDWLYRGYTGHEHLDEVGLINMNARLYDPVLGRMLSPDNYVSDPTDTQAYNRFTYANNNPLKYVDPDGNNPVLIAMLFGAFINTSSQVIRNNGFRNFSVGSMVGSAIAGGASALGLPGVGSGIRSLSNGGTFWDGYKKDFIKNALSLGIKGYFVIDGISKDPTTIINNFQQSGDEIIGTGNQIDGLDEIRIIMAAQQMFADFYSMRSLGIMLSKQMTPLSVIILSDTYKIFRANSIIKQIGLYKFTSIAVKSAINARVNRKGFSEVGYQFQKHLDRGVITSWIKTMPSSGKLNPAAYNKAGYDAFKEIWKGPGVFKKVGKFLEKRLEDGRGIRIQQDGIFKGFLDPAN